VVQEWEQTESSFFVLRLWLEPDGGDSPEWRWKIYHVQSGQERYLRSLDTVLDFVAECATVGPPQASLTGKQK